MTRGRALSSNGDGTGQEIPPGEIRAELERLLAEEEEIERRTRQHHEAPKFHGDED